MGISWEKLLCKETLVEKEKTPSSWVDYPMDPVEQDYREIVSSVSFRRLQDKAQIYQLSRGDFVRTRLTHSIEVSTVAKQLGIMMIYNDKWNHIPAFRDMPVEQARAIPTVLACAGLLHDMGNPPFGHEGEYAIGKWFRDQFMRDDFTYFGKPIREVLSPQEVADLENFEGNAQVVRMLAKCRFPSREQEANITFATMSTLLKYPVSSVEMDHANPDLRVHKFGFYKSEEQLVRRIRRETGLDLPGEPHARNPLTYLLEAADDIAYIASDVEDAVSKHTISIDQLVRFMHQKIDALPAEGDETHQLQVMTVTGILNNLEMRLQNADEDGKVAAFHGWTNYLRNWLMYVAAGSFVANWESIMSGTYQGDLLEGSLHKYTVEIMKGEMYANVYPKLGSIHVAAHTVLTDLVSRFAPAVIYWDTPQEVEFVNLTYLNIIPDDLREAYLLEKTDDETYNLYLRFRMVCDFISSLTDGNALELYKKYNAFSY